MNSRQRANIIINYLNNLYPNPPIPLYHLNSYTFLLAVLLSAQSTDKKVNELTQVLFKKASDPYTMIRLGEQSIYSYIKQLGLAKQKARHIFNLSNILIELFDGKIPSTLTELETLPGVGHKTASVVMSQIFDVPAFPVDTHIHRLAQRWGLTSGKNVLQTEKDLKSLFPIQSWKKLHLQIIYYGREYCSARSCDGTKCPLCKLLYPHRKSPIIHIKA